MVARQLVRKKRAAHSTAATHMAGPAVDESGQKSGETDVHRVCPERRTNRPDMGTPLTVHTRRQRPASQEKEVEKSLSAHELGLPQGQTRPWD